MTKRKILICDDSPETGVAYKDRLASLDAVRKDFEEPILATKGMLEEAIEQLETRLKLASNESINDYPADDAASIIDDAAILVIDYALLDLNSSATGERIAYLARCYSKCGFIIALNQYPPYVEENFDLTLRGHLESYADLNIPSNSLSNPGLWSETWNGFRPWNWPVLPQAIDKLEGRVNELREHLNENSLEFLGFTDTKALTLPRSMVEFLSRERPAETTFREFVDSGKSGNGLRGRKERAINDEAIARIAAARIGSWLEYDVLPGQDTLVDVPHLILRFPSLLGSKERGSEALGPLTSFSEPEALGLGQMIESFRFMKKDWLSRPAWFWSDLRNYQGIEEIKNPYKIRRLEQVFCEDVSRFEPKEGVREFVADLNSPYARRYVKRLEDVQYTPMVRFSL